MVRGKYGYIDPDGNKREFSYVQGNPCDPNAISNEDEEDQPGKPNEEENIPANRPNVPVNVPRPKPKKNRPTTTLFQQTFGDFEQPQPQPQPQPQLQLQSSTTPRQPGRQQLQQDAPRRPSQISPSVNAFPSTVAPSQLRPTPGVENLETAIRNLPQPSGKAQQVSAGPNSPLYTTELVFDPATGQYNTVIFQQVPKQSAGININQRLPLAPARQPQPQFQPHSPPQFQPQPQPQFRPTLQPFQPQFQQQRPAEFDFQRPVAFPSPSPPTASPQQQLIQQQQSLMFQQSQNLFRQQQQKQQLQQPQFQSQSSQFFPAPPPSQRFATSPSQFTAGPPQFATGPPQFAPLPKQQRFEQQPEAHQQQFVLVQPGRTPGQQSLAAGQIDAFLRGHNVQF